MNKSLVNRKLWPDLFVNKPNKQKKLSMPACYKDSQPWNKTSITNTSTESRLIQILSSRIHMHRRFA